MKYQCRKCGGFIWKVLFEDADFPVCASCIQQEEDENRAEFEKKVAEADARQYAIDNTD